MYSKIQLLERGVFSVISIGGLVYIYGNKYLNIETFLLLIFSREIGIIIKDSMKENNAGGTTPYNPLKIPAKKITPIH